MHLDEKSAIVAGKDAHMAVMWKMFWPRKLDGSSQALRLSAGCKPLVCSCVTAGDPNSAMLARRLLDAGLPKRLSSVRPGRLELREMTGASRQLVRVEDDVLMCDRDRLTSWLGERSTALTPRRRAPRPTTGGAAGSEADVRGEGAVEGVAEE